MKKITIVHAWGGFGRLVGQPLYLHLALVSRVLKIQRNGEFALMKIYKYPALGLISKSGERTCLLLSFFHSSDEYESDPTTLAGHRLL